MKMTLTKKQQAGFFAHAYPARALWGISKAALQEADQIIGYNSRAKIFNLFASKSSGTDLSGSWLCLIYDQDTDELELLCTAVEVAERELLYQPDGIGEDQPVTHLFDFYGDHAEEIVEEVRAMSDRMRQQ